MIINISIIFVVFAVLVFLIEWDIFKVRKKHKGKIESGYFITHQMFQITITMFAANLIINQLGENDIFFWIIVPASLIVILLVLKIILIKEQNKMLK